MIELTGNNLTLEDIEKWYLDEEAWHNQFIGGRSEIYWPVYEVFNRKYVINKYCHLTDEKKVLSFGCAEGSDTLLLKKEFHFKLFGLEASAELIKAFRLLYPDSTIVKANISGKIDYEDNFFDYIFVFSVLHHIPNVSYVLSELKRVLKKDGIMILREPIDSMVFGNVRPSSLSPHERGIPPEFIRKEIEESGMKMLSLQYSYFALLFGLISRSILLNRLSMKFSSTLYFMDKILCKIPFRYSYYSSRICHIVKPTAAYYVIQK